AYCGDASRYLGGGPDWSRTSGTRFRKPLLYPSELRGHGAATLVHRFSLRETALALSQWPRIGLATVSAVLPLELDECQCLPPPTPILMTTSSRTCSLDRE